MGAGILIWMLREYTVALTGATATARLTVRPIRVSDGAALHVLASDQGLAHASSVRLSTGEDGCFAQHALAGWENATSYTFVVADRDELWGSAVLEIDARCAHLSYWIGRPFRNRGAATTTVREVIRYAFEQLGLIEV